MKKNVKYIMVDDLTHGSLFSGIGGFELGAEMAGIETIWNCEYEDHKRETLKRHFPNSIQYKDVKQMIHPTYVDIISGGFPCQDISIANNSNKELYESGNYGIKGERSGLWVEMVRICREVRPKHIIFENSPMLLSRGLEYVLCDLSKIGYVCEWQCLQASQFGYNHKRERIYGIAYTIEKRCVNRTSIFRQLHKVLSKRASGQNAVSMPTQRYDSRTINESIRMDDGFSEQLDKTRIEDCGNAVIPEIANYLFECIKMYENNTNRR
ncbi:DNA cytosine methyltransferase [Dysgonomonas reticulitermitis]